MTYRKSIYAISLFFYSFSAVCANSEVEFSQIDEKLLLNPPGAGSTSDKVMIYSQVRNKTIHQAMNTQFNRIENMMFINTVVESSDGELSHADDDDCD